METRGCAGDKWSVFGRMSFQFLSMFSEMETETPQKAVAAFLLVSAALPRSTRENAR